jgi:two-component system chemotaxis response regulator CheB
VAGEHRKMIDTGKRIRVLIVDDSAFARIMIAKHLANDAQIEIAGTARDGLDAIEKIKVLKPDVVTLDVEMPKLDGVTALQRIMAEYPTPVVMLSNLTAEGADVTIRALEIGAVDFFLKPSLINPTGSLETDAELIQKIKQASKIDVAKVTSRLQRIVADLQRSKTKLPANKSSGQGKLNRVVIIGSSTGGPRALYEVVPNLPADLPAAVLIVQHMPPKFTKSIAERLDEISQIHVKEAELGDRVSLGQALIAPGGFHMVMKPNGQISLNQDKPRCGLRPAVDVTMESASKAYGSRCLGVILTGMGSDGTEGAAMIKAGGGMILAEDESTCVVYGMPRSVAEAGLVDKVVPLNRIVEEITAACRKPSESMVRI